MIRRHPLAKFLAALLSVAAVAAPPVSPTAWREALPGYHYNFPRDHFDHPDFRTEWWYYTGNLYDNGGRRFGFELVFFRQGERRTAPGAPSVNPSAWRVDDLYLAHAALTDVAGNHFYSTERLNRAGPGIAGISFDQRRVWNGNWSAAWQGESQHLTAIAPDFQLALSLTPRKPFVIQGENGVSQKAEGRGKASHYVSFPRLGVAGDVIVSGQKRAVTGTAWMDHEWFTHQLQAGQVGWDWFSVQLENNTELMLFQLRHPDGSLDPYSSGTFIDASGHPHHLDSKSFRLTPLEKWKRYPIHWKIEVPSLNLQLDCRAAVDAQELGTGTGATYWEGAVNYSGSAKGVGYLEMTGYDKPISLE